MLFFDLWRRSRPRCAPNPCGKRVRCSLELLETRLAPAGTAAPPPGGTTLPPPTTTPPSASAPAGASAPPLPADLAAALAANVNYTVTCSSDAQDGTGWNGCTPGSAASRGATYAGVPAVTSGTFSVSCSSTSQDGQGWAVCTLQPLTPNLAVDAVFQQALS
jgi:hypothetical protein